MDGTIEVQTLASGFLQADIWPSTASARAAEEPFGTPVYGFAEGSLHDHLFGYKAGCPSNSSLIRLLLCRPWPAVDAFPEGDGRSEDPAEARRVGTRE